MEGGEFGCLLVACKCALCSSLLLLFPRATFYFNSLTTMPVWDHLWPLWSICATLFSPFGPSLLPRVLSRARRLRVVGPVVTWVLPEEVEGGQFEQPAVVTQVSIAALSEEQVARISEAIRNAVKEALLSQEVLDALSARTQDGLQSIVAERKVQTELLERLVSSGQPPH